MTSFSRSSSRSSTGIRVGLALTVALGLGGIAAAPASAADTTPGPNPAYDAWVSTSSSSGGAQSDAAVASSDDSLGTASIKETKPTGGYRITHTHGGPLLWTANTLEWYYTSSKITSSSGSQSDGYIFPNTASKGGITRTLKTSTQHNWRGTMVIGEGTVTPWGNVNFLSKSVTDYYELLLKGKYEIN